MASNKYEVLEGDIKKVSKKLKKNSVQVIITSPPYFKLRHYSKDKYLAAEEIGREKSVDDYVSDLVAIFHSLKDVLKDDGLLWLNLGDTYINKELQGIPWRVALALMQDGWILRSDVIWQKPNAMPSSVTSRPTTDHEYVFMFSKAKDYYYYADAIREPHITFTSKSKMKGGRKHFGKVNGTPEKGKNGGNSNLHNGRWDQAFNPKGRNKRTVWSIPLSKFRGAHFAVFPKKLVEIPLKASTKIGDLVLDPFTGSGTTGVVAKEYGRSFIGVELEPEYVKMAQDRIDAAKLTVENTSLF